MSPAGRTPRQFIEDMLERAKRIQHFIGSKTEHDFYIDQLLQDAVVRNIEVLGEAASQLLGVLPDAPFRFPSIPFKAMYSTRNRLIHGYDSLRLSTVWEMAQRDIPALVSDLESILAAWPGDLA